MQCMAQGGCQLSWKKNMQKSPHVGTEKQGFFKIPGLFVVNAPSATWGLLQITTGMAVPDIYHFPNSAMNI